MALADFTGIDGISTIRLMRLDFGGDPIIRINDIKVRDADHVIKLLGQSKGEEILIEIKRGNRTW